MWVHRHRLSNSLVVFIHGIFGSRWTTWKGVVDRFQREADTDPLIRSYDFYLFQYDSGVRQPPLDPFVIDDLDRFVRPLYQSGKYSTIVFVCHSQGGVVAKLYLLRRLQRKEPLLVDRVVTFGTPHRGVWSVTPILWLQNVPLLGRMVPLRQMGQLSPWSRNMRRLKNGWSMEWRAYNAEHADAPLEAVNLVGAYDRVVRQKSAMGFAGESVRTVPEHHTMSRVEALTEEILSELRDHQRPATLLNDVVQIRSDPSRGNEYVETYLPEVKPIVAAAGGILGAGAEAVSKVAVDLMTHFLLDAECCPMRKVSLGTALATYVRRRLEHSC